MNFRQTSDESDHVYIERFDKLLLEGEPVEEDGKFFSVIGSLTNRYRDVAGDEKNWPRSYTEFREGVTVIIWMQEVIGQRLTEKDDGYKKGPMNKKSGGYRASGTFKPFEDSGEAQQLREVLAVSPVEVFK